MVVDLILKAGIPRGVCPRLSFEYDRATIRHDQPRPDQKDARLSKRYSAIIETDQARSLRDKTSPTGRRVKNIFGYLRDDLARQIGADPSDECRRNDGPGLNYEWRSRLGQTVRTSGASIDQSIDEREFTVLTVLGKCVVS